MTFRDDRVAIVVSNDRLAIGGRVACSAVNVRVAIDANDIVDIRNGSDTIVSSDVIDEDDDCGCCG